MALLQIAAALGGVAAADVLLAKIFGRLYASDRKPDAVHYTQTEDGWTIGLSEYRVPAGVKAKRPVICCHGLAGNHHSYDLTARTSLARFLAAAGYPTFVLDLRGAGYSEKGGLAYQKPLKWRLSDHYSKDAPAAVQRVLELTGAKKVHWIGHSMGGMVAYAFLQGPLAAKIERVAILASPANFEFLRPADKFRFFLRAIPGLPSRTFTQSAAPLFEVWKWVQTVSGNIDMLPGHYALSGANCQDQTPSRLLYDFTEFIRVGSFVGDDGRDLLDGLKDVRTPMLFMCGEADQTAQYGSVEAAFDACGSPKKEFVLLGKSQGHKSEYGHMTILLGEHVYDEVFPRITSWLAST
ncbi:MAG: alpha/beta hydrolase [Candidatus Lernaella stagnicola]|nr:alpha/beta hydrolase [Candidatus Lernaella stagnicola]